MGKVDGTELKNVRIDFVSFVGRGANGKGFEIYKSAEHKEAGKPETTTESIECSTEEAGIFKKFFEWSKKEKNKEEKMNLEDIAKKITDIGTTIEGVVARVATLEAPAKKSEEDVDVADETTVDVDAETPDATETPETPDTPDSVEEPTVDVDATKSTPEATTEPELTDAEKAANKIVENAFDKLNTTLKSVDERLKQVESARNPSKKVESDEKPTKKESDFKGAF